MAQTGSLFGSSGLMANPLTASYTYDIAEGLGGATKISLSDMLQAPDLALMQIVSNVRNNAWQYAIGATLFGVGAKVTRKMLRGPINTVNRLIFTGRDAPLRGMGVRI